MPSGALPPVAMGDWVLKPWPYGPRVVTRGASVLVFVSGSGPPTVDIFLFVRAGVVLWDCKNDRAAGACRRNNARITAWRSPKRSPGILDARRSALRARPVCWRLWQGTYIESCSSSTLARAGERKRVREWKGPRSGRRNPLSLVTTPLPRDTTTARCRSIPVERGVLCPDGSQRRFMPDEVAASVMEKRQ